MTSVRARTLEKAIAGLRDRLTEADRSRLVARVAMAKRRERALAAQDNREKGAVGPKADATTTSLRHE